jgi:DNA-binding NtrC family response regulator
MMRPWPGNIRELLGEIRYAAQLARADASPSVSAKHLGEMAGMATARRPTASSASSPASPERASEAALPPREQIFETLRRAGGRVATAARMLGIPRIRLRRWLEREGVDPTTLVESDEPPS